MAETEHGRTESFLGLTPGDVVSFVGAGGKSTLMSSLGRRLAKEGRKVILTATRSFRPAPGDTPYLFLSDERPFGELRPNLSEHGMLTVAPGELPDGSLAGFRPEEVDTFADVAHYLFVEAEDSVGESLPPDPPLARAVPPLTSVLCVVAGLDALGAGLDTEAFADRLRAVLAALPAIDRRVLFLHKADRRSVRRDGARVARRLRELAGGDGRPRIVLSSVRDYLKPM